MSEVNLFKEYSKFTITELTELIDRANGEVERLFYIQLLNLKFSEKQRELLER